MSKKITLEPIGRVSSSRKEPIDDEWDNVRVTIQLNSQFGSESLQGLGEFSHIEVVFIFHQVTDETIVMDARHPRGRTDWPKIGIFAQRGKNRPNRIGVTACKLVAIEGNCIEVKGLDAIDGTPILDIKPVMSGFEPRGEIREPGWAKEIMNKYW